MNNKKKICMIVQNPMVKGGIAAVVNGYRNSSLEKDYDIIYVESYKDGTKISKLLKALSGYVHFCKVLLMDKPDIIHVHSSFGPSFYRKAPFIYLSKLAKKPIINHCHGADFDNFYSTASKRKKKLIKRVYNQCSTIIALSEEWKQKLSVVASKEKIAVIENYSIIHNQHLNERLKRKSNNQILFLGEIGYRKGSYDIPGIVEKLVKLIPDFKFVIAGDGQVKEIQKLLKEKNIDKYVTFPGWVRGKEKDSMLRESDVFILPSYNEGMPMAILDAMGYGLPIISTEVGGIPKIVIDNVNGYLCKPGDVQSFTEGIYQILHNDSQRRKMSQGSVKIVEENYSLDLHLSKLKAIYEGYLNLSND